MALAEAGRADLLGDRSRRARPLGTEIAGATTERVTVGVHLALDGDDGEHVLEVVVVPTPTRGDATSPLTLAPIAAWGTPAVGTAADERTGQLTELTAEIADALSAVPTLQTIGRAALVIAVLLVGLVVLHRIVPRFAEHPARQVLGIGGGQLAVLVGYGEDPLVEAFWTRRHRLIC